MVDKFVGDAAHVLGGNVAHALRPLGRIVVHMFDQPREGGGAAQWAIGQHFAAVPPTRSADQVTQLEEEKIMGYYGAGLLYAEPSRTDPLI